MQVVREKDAALAECAEVIAQLAASKRECLRLGAKVSEVEGQKSAGDSALESLRRDLDASRYEDPL